MKIDDLTPRQWNTLSDEAEASNLFSDVEDFEDWLEQWGSFDEALEAMRELERLEMLSQVDGY